jgi:DHA1 family bicyclomycin/chloramphenicol resistance-like MFS transporter
VGAPKSPKSRFEAADATADTVRLPARLVLILGALSAFGPLSVDMYLPSLPAMAAGFRAPATAVELTLTGCVVGLGLGQLIVGPLSDTLGRRRPLLAGMVLYTVFSAACAMAPSVYLLVLFRVLQALGGAAGIVIARAVVRDLFSGRELGRFFSLLMLVIGVAPIVAPLLGGQLIRFTSWRGVFVVLTLVGAMLLIATALGLPETLPEQRRASSSLIATMRTYARLIGDRPFLGTVLAGALGFGALFAYISGSSFVLQNVYGLSAQQFSVAFGANALGIVLLSQLNGRVLLERFAARTLVTAGLVSAFAAGLVASLGVLTGIGLPMVLPALFLLVSSIGVIAPNATALALGAHPQAAGSASALLGAAQFAVGGIVAPLVGVGGPATAVPMVVLMAVLPVGALVVFRAGTVLTPDH